MGEDLESIAKQSGLKPVYTKNKTWWITSGLTNIISEEYIEAIIKNSIELTVLKYLNLDSEMYRAARKIQHRHPQAVKIAAELIQQIPKPVINTRDPRDQ